MCFAPKSPSIAAPRIAATDNREATQQADIMARLRKRRAGAAANVLTSPVGIPSTSQLGKPA
tara:strand:+ start:9157 stop:9342 length:186 start_codon:yes stop_codon:yes gene_type:complete